MRSRGQNLVEFAIIVALVAIAGIIAFTVLGDEINQLFSSSENKVENFDPFAKGYQTILSTKQINGAEVKTHGDGSVSFVHSGQEVVLSPDKIESINSAISTTATSGTDDIIEALTDMMAAYKAANPGVDDIPIELNVGYGERDKADDTFGGDTTTNTTSIFVGNLFTAIQNDKFHKETTCDPEAEGNNGCGKYKFTGTIGGTPDNPVILNSGSDISKYNFDTKQYESVGALQGGHDAIVTTDGSGNYTGFTTEHASIGTASWDWNTAPQDPPVSYEL